MEIDKIFNGGVDSIADNIFGTVNNSVSEVREMQKKKVAENVQLVIQALKKIESDLREQFGSVSGSLEKRILSIKDGKDGINGRDGKPGINGKDGKDGRDGRPGRDGLPGRPGMDGQDGVGVLGARIDFDGSLIITLTNGNEINVGEVVAPDLAESIKVITNGGGTSQSVLDTLASLQAQISAIASLGAVSYQGTWNASTNTPTITSGSGTKGYYYVVSVAGTTSIDSEAKWGVGDWIVFNGTSWQKVDGGDTGDFTNLNVSGIANFSGQLASSVMFLNASKNLATDSSFSYDGVTQTLTSPKFNVSDGTANGVAYLNASKVLTTGSALTFDGSVFTAVGADGALGIVSKSPSGAIALLPYLDSTNGAKLAAYNAAISAFSQLTIDGTYLRFNTSNAEAMRLTSTGLGIGTSSPGFKFDLNGVGAIRAGQSFRYYRPDNATYSEIYRSASATIYNDANSDGHQWQLGGTTALNLNSSGNLGLGVTPSAWGYRAFQIADARSIALSGYTTGGNFGVNCYDNAGWKYAGTGFASRYQQDSNNGSHQWYTASSSGTAGNAITFTQAMTLDSSGNLGIGTSSPAYKLDVNGNANIGSTSSVDTALFVKSSTVTGLVGAQSNYSAWSSGGLTTAMNIGTTTNNGISFGTNNIGRLNLDSSGNLGLGVTPSAWAGNLVKAFQIADNGASFSSYSTGNTSYKFAILSNNAYYDAGGWKYAQAAGSAQYRIANQEHQWYTAASGTAGDTISFTQAMTLDSSGNLLVGTTDSTLTTGNGIKLLTTAAGRNLVLNAPASTNANEGFMMYSTGAAAYRFYVQWNGTINATSTTITAISDQRFKENIRDLDDGLSTVMALKPRKFDWKTGKGKDIKNDRGFIAQEFEQVLPDMVENWRDPSPEGEEPYKAVNANLIPTLVKAIQEQQALIEQLTTRVAQLEGK